MYTVQFPDFCPAVFVGVKIFVVLFDHVCEKGFRSRCISWLLLLAHVPDALVRKPFSEKGIRQSV